jgi:hypothetical protein
VERGEQLEGDTGAGQATEGVFAVSPVRVHDGAGGREAQTRPVVIGYDDIDSGFARRIDRLHGRHAAIRRENETCTHLFSPHQASRPQVIAVPQPVRHETVHSRSKFSKTANQQGRRGHAIHIVIAVYEDSLFRLDRSLDAVDGDRQVRQQLRGRERLETRAEVLTSRFGIAVAAADEELTEE